MRGLLPSHYRIIRLFKVCYIGELEFIGLFTFELYTWDSCELCNKDLHFTQRKIPPTVLYCNNITMLLQCGIEEQIQKERERRLKI